MTKTEAKRNSTSLPNSPPPSNIEEFRPEDELDAGFLNEETTGSRRSKPNKTKSARADKEPSESSDESDRYSERWMNEKLKEWTDRY